MSKLPAFESYNDEHGIPKGPWELEYDEFDGFVIAMGSALDSPGHHYSCHKVETHLSTDEVSSKSHATTVSLAELLRSSRELFDLAVTVAGSDSPLAKTAAAIVHRVKTPIEATEMVFSTDDFDADEDDADE